MIIANFLKTPTLKNIWERPLLNLYPVSKGERFKSTEKWSVRHNLCQKHRCIFFIMSNLFFVSELWQILYVRDSARSLKTERKAPGF